LLNIDTSVAVLFQILYLLEYLFIKKNLKLHKKIIAVLIEGCIKVAKLAVYGTD
jgi:hypothetical protein